MIKKTNKIGLILFLSFSFILVWGQRNDHCLLQLRNGIDSTKTLTSDDEKSSLLMYAVKDRNLELAKQIISQGIDINYPQNGYTAVMMAAENKDIDMLRLLHSNGADLSLIDTVNTIQEFGTSILAYSLMDGCYCEDICTFLLEQNIKIENTNILIYAVYIRNLEHNKKVEFIKYLIDNGASVESVIDRSGYYLLDIANMLWDDELCSIFEDAGAWDSIMDDRPEEQLILSDEDCECSKKSSASVEK